MVAVALMPSAVSWEPRVATKFVSSAIALAASAPPTLVVFTVTDSTAAALDSNRASSAIISRRELDAETTTSTCRGSTVEPANDRAIARLYFSTLASAPATVSPSRAIANITFASVVVQFCSHQSLEPVGPGLYFTNRPRQKSRPAQLGLLLAVAFVEVEFVLLPPPAALLSSSAFMAVLLASSIVYS
jgi:hypothetical protein